MSLLDVFVRRPVMAVSINLILLVVGIVAFYHLELRHSPNSVNNEVAITIAYPGANSLVVEQQVTKPLEDALAGLDGIRKLVSSSVDNQSHIFVKFRAGVDNHTVLSQVRDRVLAAMSGLPNAVKRPIIEEQSESNHTIMYLKFEDPTRSVPELSDYIRRVVEDRLRLVEGVSAVDHFGNQPYIISVRPDPALMAEHGITVQDVLEALKREKTFASGGELEGVTGKEAVVLTATIDRPADFSNITIRNHAEGRITLGNVASVTVAYKSTFLKIRVNGRYAVGVGISAKPKANPLMVANNLVRFVKDLQKDLPASMTVGISFNATEAFAASVEEIRRTFWEAIILVGVIVILSLASFRAALMPMVTVPICLVGTFAIMLLLGFSLNPITLLALVLAVGLVVDDAIVVVENIYHHMEKGLNAFQAARHSMKEISFAVIVMTVTLAAVYLPLLYQADESAVIFREFAWTLAGSVIISGFVALTLTPALCGKFLTKATPVKFLERLTLRYRQGLAIALDHPKKIYGLLMLVACMGIYGFQRLPSEIIPREDEGYLTGFIHADNIVAEPVRNSWFQAVESTLQTIPEQAGIMTGVWQDKWMWWRLKLLPVVERARTSFEITKDLNARFKSIAGPLVQVSDNSNFDGNEALTIVLSYSGDQQGLITAAKNIMKEAMQEDRFSALSCDQTFEQPRLKVIVDRRLAAELGISIDTIEDTLYTFLSGKKVNDFNFQGLDYDIEVRAPIELRREAESLNTYFVVNTEGQWIPLGSLITLQEVLEPTEIKHYDRMRSAKISVTLKPGMTLGTAMTVLEPIIKKHIPKDARYRFGGSAEQYQESKNSLWLTFGLSIVFIYLVLAALFESFAHPFVVLLTVPLSITGAVWAIHGMGGTNNVYTIIGLVTLIGLISKHGILIVDFATRLRRLDHPLKTAVLLAAESRFRPVFMTTLAMVFGAIPLIVSQGDGAIARAHIGWVIVGGMLVGTMFSLFVVPVVYVGMAKGKRTHSKMVHNP